MIRRKDDVPEHEGIYGLMGVSPLTARAHRPPKLAKRQHKPSKPRPVVKAASGFPRPEINYNRLQIDSPAGYQNVVGVSESQLRAVQRRTEKRAKALSEMILKDQAPSMLSVEYAFEYARAALSDGFGVEVEVDDSVADTLVSLGRLDIIVFFIQRMKMPKEYRKAFIEHMLSRYADHTMTQLNATLTRNKASKALQGQVQKYEAYLKSKGVAHPDDAPAASRRGSVRTKSVRPRK